MDWMYDGMKVQTEDYLLGKKVDKHLNSKVDNGNLLIILYYYFSVLSIIIYYVTLLL